MNPGLYLDLEAEKYHAIAAMSAGGLKRMVQSPAHFWGIQMDPNRPPPGDPTPAMQNGTLVHACIFEPDAVAGRYAVKPEDFDGRTKAGKEWVEANKALEIVGATQMATARAQAAALRRLPDVAALLEHGFPESSAFWIDEPTGELCKCRPDWVSPAGEDGVILVDGKTTSGLADQRGFARTVVNFEYALQAAHYSAGYAATTGKRVHGFVFAVVESAWPHVAAAYVLPEQWLNMAETRRRQLIDLYAQCKRTNHWPGYEASVTELEMPPWLARSET